MLTFNNIIKDAGDVYDDDDDNYYHYDSSCYTGCFFLLWDHCDV